MAYNGTKLGQDARFKNPDNEILSSMKIPKVYKTTVSKHNLIILPIIKLWINKKLNDILEFEDETLANLIINLIKSSKEKIDPKNIQYQISGFLGDKTYSFMKQFWNLLISVQELYIQDKNKIPEELIPFQEEYDKKKDFFNKKKFEKNEKYYDGFNNNINYKEEIINLDENKCTNDFKEKEKVKYKIKENYYKRSSSRSISREHYNYRNKKRSRSQSRSIEKSSRSEYSDIKGIRERYKNKSRSRHRRYSYSRSSSRSRRHRHKNRRSRSRNLKKFVRVEKEKYYKEDLRNKKNKEKQNEIYEDDSYINNSRRQDLRNATKKDIANNENKSLSSDSSSETLKLEQKSLLSGSSSEENQNTKYYREK